MILCKLHSLFGLGKWIVPADLDSNHHSTAALRRHFGPLSPIALNGAVIAVWPPEADEILIGKTGVWMPNLVGPLRISRDDRVHEARDRVLFRGVAQQIREARGDQQHQRHSADDVAQGF